LKLSKSSSKKKISKRRIFLSKFDSEIIQKALTELVDYVTLIADNLKIIKGKKMFSQKISNQEQKLFEIIKNLKMFNPKSEDGIIKELSTFQNDLFEVIIDITSENILLEDLMKEFVQTYTKFITKIKGEIKEQHRTEFEMIYKQALKDYSEKYHSFSSKKIKELSK